jgi:outer membrane protein assembly factor BamB
VRWFRILGDGTSWTFQGDVLARDDAGNVYAGLQGYRALFALDAAGRTRWTHDMPNQLWDHSTGLTVSVDGTVYVFDLSGNGAALSSDGTVRWAVPVVGPDPHGRFALAPAGELYAAGDRGLSRLDPATGAALWTVPLVTYYGGPAVARDGRVVSQFDRELLVTDPSGNVLFNQMVTGPEGAAYPLLMSSMGWDGTSYLQRSSLSAVTLDGTLLWQIPIGQLRAEPVIAVDGRVFTFTAVDQSQSAIALSDSGTTLWEQPLGGWSYIPRMALLADQTLLAMTGPNLYRLDAATGAVLNTIALPMDVASAPVVNPDGTILLLTNDHRLIALQGWAPLDPDAPWPTWRRDNRRTAALPPAP